MHIITEEVNGLTSRVYFCLIEILTLSEHTGRIHDRTVFGCQQLCHLHHDSGACCPWRATPNFMSLHGCLNGHFYLFLAHLMVSSQHMLMIVRTGHLTDITCTNLLATDNNRDINDDITLTLKFFLQCHALRRTFQISLYRFVCR